MLSCVRTSATTASCEYANKNCDSNSKCMIDTCNNETDLCEHYEVPCADDLICT
jgi:hypothetical protein